MDENGNKGTAGCLSNYLRILSLLTALAVIFVYSTRTMITPQISGVKVQQKIVTPINFHGIMLDQQSYTTSRFSALKSAKPHLGQGYWLSTPLSDQGTGSFINQSSTTSRLSARKSAKSHSGQGYWLSTHFSDQGTGSFINLMSFLCLAKTVGVRVVEPFMYGSNLGLDVNANWTSEVTFSQIFNIDEFHRFSKLRGYGTLVSYQNFLKDAPHKVIVAQYECHDLSLCRTCNHTQVLREGRIFAKMNGLEMVGVVCLKYKKGHGITVEELNRQLYSEYKKSELVVIFLPLYGGIANEGFRLNVNPSRCGRYDVKRAFYYIKPSKLVDMAAENYKKLYLGDNHYMSVMVRFEMILSHKLTFDAVSTCLTNLHNRIQKLKSQYNISKVVLCQDTGMYGSIGFRSQDPRKLITLTQHLNKFISNTVKEGMNLTDLDETFSKATAKQNPGFVAVMQKSIAAKGDVLVQLGGYSSYQASTKEMYNALHKKRHVVKLSKSCA